MAPKGSGKGRAGGPVRRIVQTSDGGGWEVKAPNASRASARRETQAQAIERARQIVANQGGGEVTIKNREGKIRDSDTVAPGNDPNPPRDTR